MLVYNTDIVRGHVGGIAKELHYDTLRPFLQHAEYEVAQLIGIELMAALHAEVLVGPMADLLDQVQRTISLIGWQESLVGTLYQMGNAGLSKFMPKDATKLSMWELDTMLTEAGRRADDAIEQLMTFLANRAPELPVWKNSDTFADLNRQLIPSAALLQESLPEVAASYRLWASLRLYFPKIERRAVMGVTGGPTLTALKDKLAAGAATAPWPGAGLSTEEAELWEYCRNYLALVSLHEALPFIRVKFSSAGIQIESSFKGLKDGKAANDDQVQELRKELAGRAEVARNELKNFLNATASPILFPNYFNSRLYVAPGSHTWKLPDNDSKNHFRL